MSAILVTGGAGFIGSNFIRYALRADPACRIINLDALTYAGSLENLKALPDPSRQIFIHGNICDRALVDQVLQEHRITTIVHLAAESHVDRSIHHPCLFVETNIVGTFTLLEAARAAWLKIGDRRSNLRKSVTRTHFRFHHISSDEVFGSLGPESLAFTEASPYDPSSPYSASKAASDHLVRAYARTYGLPVTISHCSNTYGPHQYPEKLIPLMILNALEGKSLPIYGDGQQIRDWLYVEDHCEAIWRILLHGKSGQTYNIGGNHPTANLDIVSAICNLLDELVPATVCGQRSPTDTRPSPYADLITFVQDRPGHDRHYELDCAKIKRELGWQPRHTLIAGLRQTVQWYLDHPEWIAAIRRGYAEMKVCRLSKKTTVPPPLSKS